jgi:predicted MFS family arabinose efflux permease
MVGGAVGTTLGGRLIEATGYRELYVFGGLGLAALTLIALVAVPGYVTPGDGVLRQESASDRLPA